MLEDDGITAAIEELQSRLGDLQSSIDQALQVNFHLVGYFKFKFLKLYFLQGEA